MINSKPFRRARDIIGKAVGSKISKIAGCSLSSKIQLQCEIMDSIIHNLQIGGIVFATSKTYRKEPKPPEPPLHDIEMSDPYVAPVSWADSRRPIKRKRKT